MAVHIYIFLIFSHSFVTSSTCILKINAFQGENIIVINSFVEKVLHVFSFFASLFLGPSVVNVIMGESDNN